MPFENALIVTIQLVAGLLSKNMGVLKPDGRLKCAIPEGWSHKFQDFLRIRGRFLVYQATSSIELESPPISTSSSLRKWIWPTLRPSVLVTFAS